jgi:hypothetical protein
MRLAYQRTRELRHDVGQLIQNRGKSKSMKEILEFVTDCFEVLLCLYCS